MAFVRLSSRTLDTLAEMVCGSDGPGQQYSWATFPYRTSSGLTRIFKNAGLDHVHTGGTRKYWALDVLTQLNNGPSTSAQLPADALVRVLQELMHPQEFERGKLDRVTALRDLNEALGEDGIEVYLDDAGRAQVRNTGTRVSSASLQLAKRTWTAQEVERRNALSRYLDRASEDEFIVNILVPMYSQLGFTRVSPTGHKDKQLEYGKDVWMKYQLPTAHYLYFGIQAKKGKLDSAGRSKNENVSEVLNQVRMMLDSPIFDPEINKKVLLDHVFIASASEITKAAKNWLAEHLDQNSRRHVLFVDREDVLTLCLSVNLPVPIAAAAVEDDDDLPF
jgi:predicted peroxiredoxin